jgi:hypothetical protein
LAVIGLLSEALTPAACALSLPRWTAMAFALLALGGFAYAERALWLSRSLWALGVVARAWRMVGLVEGSSSGLPAAAAPVIRRGLY